MKSQVQRINNVIGQLEAIKRMIESEETDCFKVLTQMKAAKSGMTAVMQRFIDEQFSSCASYFGTQEDKDKMKKLIAELSKD